MLSEKDISEEYNLRLPFLRKKHLLREGPRYLKIGRLVRYSRGDPRDVAE